MADLATINIQFLISFTIILIGYFFKRIGLITQKDGDSLSKVILNLTLPTLIIVTISNIELDPSLILLPFICLIFTGIFLGIAFLVFRKNIRKLKGNILILTIGYNIGLFAYPLIEGIFGSEGLVYIAMFDVGNAFVMFGIVFIIGSIYSVNQEEQSVDIKYILRKAGTNLPLLSYIIALIINLTFGGLNGFIYDLFSVIAVANQPLVLLLLGIFLSLNIEKSHWSIIFKVLLLRYGLGLVVGILLYLILPFNELFRTILLISFILPIGMAVIPYTIQFDYDKKLTGALTNLTIVISFAIMWIILSLLSIG